jgi:glycosyltransferase involved in cell wall biosynthesis
VSRRRVLLVSYHFPPVGGAGVQRPAKFARYLPEFGWDVSVLQAANPSVPLLDASLLKDLPADLVTVKARTLEPGYATKSASGVSGSAPRGTLRKIIGGAIRRAATMALQPDPQVLWLPAARRAGRDLLNRMPHHAILATAPSYTNLVLGSMLKRHSGLPFLADYRDEWDVSSAYWENAPRDPISRQVQAALQRRVLRSADAVIATTEASTARLAQRAREASAHPITECIYNGWDPGDLIEAAEALPAVPRDPGKFRLVYTGTLWNLTSIAPVVQAVEQLAATHPVLAARLELVVLGRKTPDQDQLLQRLLATPTVVHLPGYAPHPVALATMQSADALLLLLSDVPGAERVAPAKLFEYLAVGRPMLAVTPDGETAGIVRSVEADGWRAAHDVAGITRWLIDRLEGRTTPALPGRDATRAGFQRRQQSQQLAALLDRVVEGRP